MNNLKKFQDEKLEMKERESVFDNKYENIREFRNVSTGNENHLYTKFKESIKNAKAIEST